MRDLRAQAQIHQDKLRQIKVFLTDVDGVLTDGMIHYDGHEVGFNRSFNALDGYGFKLLKMAGIKTGFISGGKSISLNKRAEYLGLDYFFIGNEDKRHAFNSVLKDGYQFQEILYIGDDLFDLPLLKKAGFSATVNGAPLELVETVDYITLKKGGDGAVREVIDLLRYARNFEPEIPDFD